ncbi:MAG: zf-TFIIB domain-containing protein [Paenibacillaceae bacterium]|uniref:TFIIB-type zinc ribbon-containing protein n=1 Tax=Paenibacillus cymbidii TaxID=1639034 RepID=UPI0010821A40|nr:zf-TFIIB domain-containing protein [Paenibacillus cymbidii]MBO9605368.1 zf-TFIIB domain-containing protein [Paenibacillaceae bacterium]
MNCPVCHDTRMREVQKNDVMIDICPSCKGVWLDRGELDKLMSDVKEVRDDYNKWYYDEPGKRRERDDDDDDDDYKRRGPNDRNYRPPHRKKSVLDRLGDLFD